MWRTFVAVAMKEVRHVARERRVLESLLLWQLLTGLVMTFVDPSIRHVPMVVADQDRSTESRELLARVEATGVFDVVAMAASKEAIRTEVVAGRAKVALVIPARYGEARARGGQTDVLAVVDGSDAAASARAIATLQGVVDRTEQVSAADGAAGLSEPVTLRTHVSVLFNPNRLAFCYTLPGGLAMALGLMYAGRVARSIARERTEGNLERLVMTPMSHDGFVLGKMVTWFVVASLNGAAYLVVMRIVGVPIRGSVPLLLVGMTLYLATILGLGALVGSKSTTSEVSWVLGLLSQPSVVLTGYVLPLFSLPGWLQPISYVFPQTHFIQIARGICMRGAGAWDLLPHLVYLTVAPLFLGALASRRFAEASTS